MADAYIDYLFRFTGGTRKADALATLGAWLRDDPSQEDGVGYDKSHIQRFRVVTAEAVMGTDPVTGMRTVTTPATYAAGLFVHIALRELRPDVRDISQCFLVLSRQRALDGLNPVLLNRAPVALRNLRFTPVFAGCVYQARVPTTVT